MGDATDGLRRQLMDALVGNNATEARQTAQVYADALEEGGDERCVFWRLVGGGKLWPLCVGTCVKWWWDKRQDDELMQAWRLPGRVAARLKKKGRPHNKTWHGGERVVFYFAGKNKRRNALVAAESAWVQEYGEVTT